MPLKLTDVAHCRQLNTVEVYPLRNTHVDFSVQVLADFGFDAAGCLGDEARKVVGIL